MSFFDDIVGNKLDVTRWTIGDDIDELGVVLERHPFITKIDLSRTELSAGGIRKLAFMGLNSMTKLDLGNNYIDAEGAEALALLLKTSSLLRLDLGYNQIGPEGAKALAGSLKDSLRKLDLFGNDIGDEGAAALAEGLKGSSLTWLSLYSNKIGNKGATALAKVLKETSLTNLNFYNNNIGDEGAAALALGIKGSLISELNIAGNEFGAEGIKAFAGVLGGSMLKRLVLTERADEDDPYLEDDVFDILRESVDNALLIEEMHADGHDFVSPNILKRNALIQKLIRKSILTFLACRWFRSAGNYFLFWCPKEIFVKIAKHLYETRCDPTWKRLLLKK